MRFKTTLPKGCMVKAGGIPVRLCEAVDCESGTPIRVEFANGVGLVAMADTRSIDKTAAWTWYSWGWEPFGA